MSNGISRFRTNEPVYYHREYSNDINNVKKEYSKNSWIDNCKRVALVALPFCSLYKPTSFSLSLAMGGLRTWSCLSQLAASLEHGDLEEIPQHTLQVAISVTALVGTIFAHPLGMLITTAHDLVIEIAHLINHIQKGEQEKALESCANILNNALYLSLFLHGGLELAIASLAMQILLGLYHSHDEFKNGKYLEGAGLLLMSVIRGNQLVGQVKLIQLKWKIEELKNCHQEKLSKTSSTASTANKLDRLNRSIIQASRVEHAYWNGVHAHIGYYQSGVIIVTIQSGQQYAYLNGNIIASTNYWVWEAINGITYAKHIYGDGTLVYSADYSQFAVIP